LVEASELNLVPRSPSFKITLHLAASAGGSLVAAPSPWDSAHLVGEKVFVQFSDEDAQVHATKWVVGTGTTNHMMGVWGAFSELDTSVYGTFMFNDASVVRIEGCGIIMFQCKNDEHRSFSSIYFIHKLKIQTFWGSGNSMKLGMKFSYALVWCASRMKRDVYWPRFCTVTTDCMCSMPPSHNRSVSWRTVMMFPGGVTHA
jgi:hypothetical protein